ncbi:MAG: zinc ribbon domain-containing protein [Planctomycetota bacterium]
MLLFRFVVFSSFTLFLAAVAGARTWTDDQGETFTATFLRVSGNIVVMNDGSQVIHMPLDSLSSEDRAWVAACCSVEKKREWHTVTGGSIVGLFLRYESGKVVLRTGAGERSVWLDRLSRADRELLNRATDGDVPQQVPSSPTVVTTNLPSEERLWTSASGKEIVAEFVRIDGDRVVLRMKGKEYRVRLNRLSEADRQYVADRQKAFASEAVPSFEEVADDQSATSSRNVSRTAIEQTPDPEPTPVFDALIADGGPYSYRVENSGGQRRVWANGFELFGADADRLVAYMREHGDRLATEKYMPAEAMSQHQAWREQDRQQRLSDREEALERRRRWMEKQAEQKQPRYPQQVSRDNAGKDQGEVTPVFSYQCYSCNNYFESTRKTGVGDKCPHCGVEFNEYTDEDGVTQTTAWSPRGIGRVIVWSIVGIASLVGWLARRT